MSLLLVLYIPLQIFVLIRRAAFQEDSDEGGSGRQSALTDDVHPGVVKDMREMFDALCRGGETTFMVQAVYQEPLLAAFSIGGGVEVLLSQALTLLEKYVETAIDTGPDSKSDPCPVWFQRKLESPDRLRVIKELSSLDKVSEYITTLEGQAGCRDGLGKGYVLRIFFSSFTFYRVVLKSVV